MQRLIFTQPAPKPDELSQAARIEAEREAKRKAAVEWDKQNPVMAVTLDGWHLRPVK
jgi:hypothetical protein